MRVSCSTRVVHQNAGDAQPAIYREHYKFTIMYKNIGNTELSFHFIFSSILVCGHVLTALKNYGIETVDARTKGIASLYITKPGDRYI